MNPLLREAVTRVFGHLSVRPSGFYSEVAGEVLWTEDKKTPGGVTYRIVFMFDAGNDDLPAAVVADLWWDAPVMRSSLTKELPAPPSPRASCPNVLTTEEHVACYHTVVMTRRLSEIDQTYAGMLERAQALRKKS